MTLRRVICTAVLGLFMPLLVACGSSPGTPTKAPSGGTAPTAASTTAASTAAASTAATTAPKPTNTPNPPPAAAKTYGLNQLVNVKNWDLAIQKVETPGKELIWSQFGNKSVAAGTWFVVVVDMKNTGNQNFGVNASDFELKAGNVTYKVSDDFGTYTYSEFKGAQRIGGQVPPGVNVTYYIAFDVSPTAADLQLIFKQDTKPTFGVGNAFVGNAPPATAPSTAPAAAPAAKPANGQTYGLNELARVKNWDLAIQKVEKPGKELIWSQFGNKSVAAGTWFVVVVDMKNTGNQNFGVNASDFELKAGNVTYKVSDDFGTYTYSEFKGAQRIGGQVPPGVNVTYYIAFDVAPTAADLQITFKQDTKPIFGVGNAGP